MTFYEGCTHSVILGHTDIESGFLATGLEFEDSRLPLSQFLSLERKEFNIKLKIIEKQES